MQSWLYFLFIYSPFTGDKAERRVFEALEQMFSRRDSLGEYALDSRDVIVLHQLDIGDECSSFQQEFDFIIISRKRKLIIPMEVLCGQVLSKILRSNLKSPHTTRKHISKDSQKDIKFN